MTAIYPGHWTNSKHSNFSANLPFQAIVVLKFWKGPQLKKMYFFEVIVFNVYWHSEDHFFCCSDIYFQLDFWIEKCHLNMYLSQILSTSWAVLVAHTHTHIHSGGSMGIPPPNIQINFFMFYIHIIKLFINIFNHCTYAYIIRF